MRRPRDIYCADGIISHGERLVRKGGRISFGGYDVQDDKLLPWVGEWVFVTVDDYWFQAVCISDAKTYTDQICVSPVKVKKKPTK
jgi:hypothetical protein